ncbi:MAG: hypothetical protein QOK40_2228 [Miltoncostaeaceae bacterium]|jgi:hypothetical protein|nr:hypothetical protein [Miltoncostaeaceae bacterium]
MCYNRTQEMAPERFDPDLLDPAAPFELDMNNVPHLVKHPPFTHQDVLDAWLFGEPVFFPPRRRARPTG